MKLQFQVGIQIFCKNNCLYLNIQYTKQILIDTCKFTNQFVHILMVIIFLFNFLTIAIVASSEKKTSGKIIKLCRYNNNNNNCLNKSNKTYF